MARLSRRGLFRGSVALFSPRQPALKVGTPVIPVANDKVKGVLEEILERLDLIGKKILDASHRSRDDL